MLLSLLFSLSLSFVVKREIRCGTDFGGSTCPAGLCCSQWDYCGDTEAHCTVDQGLMGLTQVVS